MLINLCLPRFYKTSYAERGKWILKTLRPIHVVYLVCACFLMVCELRIRQSTCSMLFTNIPSAWLPRKPLWSFCTVLSLFWGDLPSHCILQVKDGQSTFQRFQSARFLLVISISLSKATSQKIVKIVRFIAFYVRTCLCLYVVGLKSVSLCHTWNLTCPERSLERHCINLHDNPQEEARQPSVEALPGWQTWCVSPCLASITANDPCREHVKMCTTTCAVFTSIAQTWTPKSLKDIPKRTHRWFYRRPLENIYSRIGPMLLLVPRSLSGLCIASGSIHRYNQSSPSLTISSKALHKDNSTHFKILDMVAHVDHSSDCWRRKWMYFIGSRNAHKAKAILKSLRICYCSLCMMSEMKPCHSAALILWWASATGICCSVMKCVLKTQHIQEWYPVKTRFWKCYSTWYPVNSFSWTFRPFRAKSMNETYAGSIR